MPDAATLTPGSCLPLAYLPVSLVFPACLPVSPSLSPSLCGRMLRRWLRGRVSCFACLPVSGCQMLSRWLRGRVSRLSPCVSHPPLVSMPDAVTPAPGRVSRLSVSLAVSSVSAVRCQILECCDAPKLPWLFEPRCPRPLALVGPRKARGKLKGRYYSVKKP